MSEAQAPKKSPGALSSEFIGSIVAGSGLMAVEADLGSKICVASIICVYIVCRTFAKKGKA